MMIRNSVPGLRRLPPPSDAERQRTLALLERIRARREALLARNGGRFFPDSAEIVRDLRAERDGELA